MPMPTNFWAMPLDKTLFKTRVRLRADLFGDPNRVIQSLGLEVRTSKPTRGLCARGPARILNLKLLVYGGIELKLVHVDGDPLTTAEIRFNPGVCLHGHNGHVLSLPEFFHALGLLVTHLRPLLADPADWVDLVPGVRTDGVASWEALEVNFHAADPDGAVLSAFRHAVHPGTRASTTRHWPDSISFGGHRSKLRIAIYRKGAEMARRGKLPDNCLPDVGDVLRFEVRLRGEKLADYLGNERNMEKIDGVPRLVRFYPEELVAGLRNCLGEFRGVYSSPPSETAAGRNADTGRLLARVALDPRTRQTFPELLEILRAYHGPSRQTGAARNSFSRALAQAREGGMAELSGRSDLLCGDLLSDAAFRAQRGIASEEVEQKVTHECNDLFADPRIFGAYRPANRPFEPMVQWPGYLLP